MQAGVVGLHLRTHSSHRGRWCRLTEQLTCSWVHMTSPRKLSKIWVVWTTMTFSSTRSWYINKIIQNTRSSCWFIIIRSDKAEWITKVWRKWNSTFEDDMKLKLKLKVKIEWKKLIDRHMIGSVCVEIAWMFVVMCFSFNLYLDFLCILDLNCTCLIIPTITPLFNKSLDNTA